MTDITHDAPTAVPDPHHPHSTGHEHEHAHGTGIYWAVFGALMLLLVATVGAAYLNLGVLNVPIAYLIATIKALLVLWFFMHLNESTRLTQVFAFASFAWLVILLAMTGGDYLTRHMPAVNRADPLTHIRGVDSYDYASGRKANQIGPKHGGEHNVAESKHEVVEPNLTPQTQH